MSIFQTHSGPFVLTIWGNGTSVELRKGEYSIHWQGDEAAEIVDAHDEHGLMALERIWDDHSDLATRDGE